MLQFDKYGHLMNSGGQCAATSTINSFQFLVNQYPGVYGQTSLIPGAGTDLPSARDKLNSGWDFNGQHRNGMAGCPGGLNFQGIWEAKGDWLDDFVPTQQR